VTEVLLVAYSRILDYIHLPQRGQKEDIMEFTVALLYKTFDFLFHNVEL
jgi:hypothetical protein